MLLQGFIGESPPMSMLRKLSIVWTHDMVMSFSCVRPAQGKGVLKDPEGTRGTCDLSNSAGSSMVTKAKDTNRV